MRAEGPKERIMCSDAKHSRSIYGKHWAGSCLLGLQVLCKLLCNIAKTLPYMVLFLDSKRPNT